ncbi:MAG TPA: flagellar basal body rod protein FlgC, partial [Ramlibacter sp.]
DYLKSFAISAAGMGVERTRVEVASLNLANAHTVQTPGGVPFQPLRVVATVQRAFGSLVDHGLRLAPVPVASVEPSGAPPRMVHEPAHPLADARGFVAYPGVNPATEMVSLMSAARAYEANVVAMSTARTLVLKALEIGRST